MDWIESAAEEIWDAIGADDPITKASLARTIRKHLDASGHIVVRLKIRPKSAAAYDSLHDQVKDSLE